ncbi:IclR family transcriptional regulator [Pseudonocardia spinosispora]|uniref:IclR family transcriptional regulator n=1 Tax=Pseudonocardia spinosispora TaxID=103441 RepID=UPI00041047A1|nr:IclR family transcriptional regulator [Pseudonocardia spinosispora]
MIQAVDRAVRILTALQGARRMSLGEIATELDLAPSTVHGIIRTLLQHGMVAQERDSGRYRLGPATLRLGNVYLHTLELRSRVISWSEDLAKRTGCAVRAGVLLLGEVVVVHHEPRPDGTRQMPEVGIVIPAHACALGKALVAYAHVEETLAAGLRSMTGDTITQPAALLAEIDEVKRTGLATEVEEAVIGECGVAAPLVDASGMVPGALSLVVPTSRWPLADSDIEALRDAARSISHELGAPSWPPIYSADSAASA